MRTAFFKLTENCLVHFYCSSRNGASDKLGAIHIRIVHGRATQHFLKETDIVHRVSADAGSCTTIRWRFDSLLDFPVLPYVISILVVIVMARIEKNTSSAVGTV